MLLVVFRSLAQLIRSHASAHKLQAALYSVQFGDSYRLDADPGLLTQTGHIPQLQYRQNHDEAKSSQRVCTHTCHGYHWFKQSWLAYSLIMLRYLTCIDLLHALQKLTGGDMPKHDPQHLLLLPQQQPPSPLRPWLLSAGGHPWLFFCEQP